MSHFAELNDNNKVIRVLVGDNNDPAGDEGYSWLVNNLGGTWVQTSYNAKIRYNFAGIGYFYDEVSDAFIPPMPECGHEELLLNHTNFQWECSNEEHTIEALAE
jgi:hypothetical protein